ncbi:J domain-containing protein [Halopenitus persicus]|uniref:J domain-containing protein n=1 Tax=Halopenitus persicus TaxID=1048396 RepID=UPI000BBB5F7C|nr:J domain-containing protein [Halopenitus persicus]
MVVDTLPPLPAWLLIGIGVGTLATGGVVVLFYFGDRLLPAGGAPAAGASVDGDARRRTEIRSYLSAIDERFREDHPVAGDPVDFYLPDREVAITFDAQQFFRLERAGIAAVLCEHELPGRGLGDRLPFDTPDASSIDDPTRGPGSGGFGTAGDPGSDPVATAFAELELPRSTDEEAVKRAYRERVKDVHPDQGGDEEAFRRVREAYATATEYCRRADGTVEPAPRPAADRSRAATATARARRSRRERR